MLGDAGASDHPWYIGIPYEIDQGLIGIFVTLFLVFAVPDGYD